MNMKWTNSKLLHYFIWNHFRNYSNQLTIQDFLAQILELIVAKNFQLLTLWTNSVNVSHKVCLFYLSNRNLILARGEKKNQQKKWGGCGVKEEENLNNLRSMMSCITFTVKNASVSWKLMTTHTAYESIN